MNWVASNFKKKSQGKRRLKKGEGDGHRKKEIVKGKGDLGKQLEAEKKQKKEKFNISCRKALLR